MANSKRASMREGPLAALFRKTEDGGAPRRRPRLRGRAAAAGRRAAGGPDAGRAPLAPRPLRRRGPRRAASHPDAEERLRNVFSSDIPENILDGPGARTRYAMEPDSAAGSDARPGAARRRRRRRRRERGQPHDRGRRRGRRLHRRQHRRAVARAVRARTSIVHIGARRHARPRLGLEPRARPQGRPGGLRPPQRRCSRAPTWSSSRPAPAAAPARARRPSWRASRASWARSRSASSRSRSPSRARAAASRP